MEATAVKLEYDICESAKGGIPAIIVAAGSCTRMNGINKQLLELDGIPVIVRTLKAFEGSPEISRIILVTRKESIVTLQSLADKYMISKLTDICEGGSDRHSSVLCGMERLTADEKKVLIQDGARPFCTAQMIADAAGALKDHDGSLCAVKISDTIKLAASDGTVTGTLDRSMLYSAQTPQGVDVALYKEASAKSEDRSGFTDDASVLESAGHTVKIVEGSPSNIKITTRDDIPLAEAILRRLSLCE